MSVLGGRLGSVLDWRKDEMSRSLTSLRSAVGFNELEPPGGPLGATWGVSGVSRAFFRPPRVVMGPPWAALEAYEAVFGLSWGHLGCFGSVVGPSWRQPWAISAVLEAFWRQSWSILGPSWGPLGPSLSNVGGGRGHLRLSEARKSEHAKMIESTTGLDELEPPGGPLGAAWSVPGVVV